MLRKHENGYTLAIHLHERLVTEYGSSHLKDEVKAFAALLNPEKSPFAELDLGKDELSDKAIKSFCLAHGFTKKDLQ